MELIEIVDKEGNSTGQIIEKEEAHDKNILHNEVVVYIINKNGEILLQKRASTKRFSPNKWALCAGHVQAHETLLTAALRELQEELGIKTSEEKLVPFEKELCLKSKNSRFSHMYYLKLDLPAKDFILQKEELSEVKWTPIDEIITMIKMSNNPTVFDEKEIPRFEKLKKLNGSEL